MRAFILLILTAGLVAMPFYLMLLAFGATITPRLDSEGAGLSWLMAEDGFAQIGGYLSEQLAPALLHLVALPDTSALYYGGTTALILPWMLPFFLVGVGVALRRFRGGSLLLLWIGLVVLGNSLLQEPAYSARFVVAFPPLVIVMALGMVAVWRWVLTVGKNQPADAKNGVPTDHTRFVGTAYWPSAVLLLLIIGQLAYYFGPHLTTYNHQIRPTYDSQDAAFRTRDLPPETLAFLLTDELVYVPVLEAILRLDTSPVELQTLPTYGFPFDVVDDLPRDVEYAFFLAPDDSATLDRLQAAFGQTFDGPFFSPYNVPLEKQYALYRLDVD